MGIADKGAYLVVAEGPLGRALFRFQEIELRKLNDQYGYMQSKRR